MRGHTRSISSPDSLAKPAASSSSSSSGRGHTRWASGGAGLPRGARAHQPPSSTQARRSSDSTLVSNIRKARRQSTMAAAKHRGVKAWRRDDDNAHLAELRRLELTLLSGNLELGAGATQDAGETSPVAVARSAEGLSPEISVGSSYPEQGVEMTSVAKHDNPMQTAAQQKTARDTGLDKFKRAVRRVKLQNTLSRSFDSTRYNLGREKQQSSHVRPWCSAVKVVLHLISLALNLWLADNLWTYDGLDAVEMVEDQILRGTRYDHFHSEYTDVDSHASFAEVSDSSAAAVCVCVCVCSFFLFRCFH